MFSVLRMWVYFSTQPVFKLRSKYAQDLLLSGVIKAELFFRVVSHNNWHAQRPENKWVYFSTQPVF